MSANSQSQSQRKKGFYNGAFCIESRLALHLHVVVFFFQFCLALYHLTWEEGAGLCASSAFVCYFAHINLCLFPLPLPLAEACACGTLWTFVQGSPFITLCLGSTELDRVISESCYKGIIYKETIGK